MTLSLITGTTVENTTTAVATSALTSPVWLPWLYAASDGAARVAPLLGAIWLLVQIVAKVRELLKKDPKK